MENVNTQQILDELEARDTETFDLQDADQVRLENGIYTAGEYEDGSGFDMTVEDHVSDIPFIGEIYYQGARPTELSERTFIKEHDIINSAGSSYMVVRLHQKEDEDGYSLIELESLNSAFSSVLALKR